MMMNRPRAALERKRIFRSQVFVPVLESGYVLLSWALPSAHIRLHFDMEHPPLPDPPYDDRRVKKMSRWLEWYMLVVTALLFLFVWSQSHPWAWQHSWWGWILRVFVALLLVIRIGEILSQTVEVALNRIDVDAPSGLMTLAIYIPQTVAIWAICSEYATYASGYHQVFKSDDRSFPSDWLDYLYLSWTNLVTFGAAYPPQTSWAMVVVVCSSATFILLFSVLLAFVVSKIQPDQSQPSHTNAVSQPAPIPDSAVD